MRSVTGRLHGIAPKNEYTHDVKAGLSLPWAHNGISCLIDAFMFHFNEPRLEKTAQLVLHSTILFLPKSDIS